MAWFGMGHLLVALFFAVHVVRTGRSLFWVFILFSFPFLGALLYFLMEYLPGQGANREVRRALGAAGQMLDPERDVHDARVALELLPSAQNQLQLAQALLERGETLEAVQHFESCLAGPFGRDPEIRYGAARAHLANGDMVRALEITAQLRADCPDYQPEPVMLLLAQVLAASGDRVGAKEVFTVALERFGSVEVRGQYAIFAARNADLATAERLQRELAQAAHHWPSHARALNRALLRNVEMAINAARRSA